MTLSLITTDVKFTSHLFRPLSSLCKCYTTKFRNRSRSAFCVYLSNVNRCNCLYICVMHSPFCSSCWIILYLQNQKFQHHR